MVFAFNMAKSVLLFLLIFLMFCCDLAKGDHDYSNAIDDRMNTLENELESTKETLVKTEHRLGETELKNKHLEMKLQRSIETFDSKYKKLNDMIENTLTTLSVTNDKLKSTDAELRFTQEELKITTTTLHTTIANLKSYFNNVDSNDSLDSKPKNSKFRLVKDFYKQRNGTRSNLVQNVASEERSGQRLTTDKTETYSKVKRVDELGSVIAFHAELGPHKTNLAADATIKFETVKQNFGNAYDPLLGVFNCPMSGLYFFTFTIMSNPGKTIETKLVVNGSPIAYSYSTGPPGPPGLHNAGSKSVVTRLNSGDRVWIAFYQEHDNNVYGSTWSTFTGFMIKET